MREIERIDIRDSGEFKAAISAILGNGETPITEQQFLDGIDALYLIRQKALNERCKICGVKLTKLDRAHSSPMDVSRVCRQHIEYAKYQSLDFPCVVDDIEGPIYGKIDFSGCKVVVCIREKSDWSIGEKGDREIWKMVFQDLGVKSRKEMEGIENAVGQAAINKAICTIYPEFEEILKKYANP